MTQPNLFQPPEPLLVRARRQADAGASRAVAHAERVQADWQARATQMVARFAGAKAAYNHPDHEPWLAEEARAYAEREGVPPPPDGRAWGAVMQACRRAGLIVPCGYAPAVSSNGSPKTMWKRA